MIQQLKASLSNPPTTTENAAAVVSNTPHGQQSQPTTKQQQKEKKSDPSSQSLPPPPPPKQQHLETPIEDEAMPAAPEEKQKRKRQRNKKKGAEAATETTATNSVVTPTAATNFIDTSKDRYTNHSELVEGTTTHSVVWKPPRPRSRQKNLKKDKRPDHLKPTYLTPGAPDYIPPYKRQRLPNGHRARPQDLVALAATVSHE